RGAERSESICVGIVGAQTVTVSKSELLVLSIYHMCRLRGREAQPDRWFGSAESRARLERILRRPGAITGPVRRAILNGESLIQVDVYTRSVEVILLRR